MKFTWILVVLCALFALAAARVCPANFEEEHHLCTSKRPVHGTCPDGSDYRVNINKCVFKD